jgi:trimethylamine--corrinoid protein Co-methyltransferase
MLHTAGWLEGGLAMGYEKFIMDCDQASMISVLLGGMDMSENGQALDAVREVGPGKHYLGSAHTLKNFEAAFYRSTVADNNSYEQWQADGSLDTAQRANGLWKKNAQRISTAGVRCRRRRGIVGFYGASQGRVCRSRLLALDR